MTAVARLFVAIVVVGVLMSATTAVGTGGSSISCGNAGATSNPREAPSPGGSVKPTLFGLACTGRAEGLSVITGRGVEAPGISVPSFVIIDAEPANAVVFVDDELLGSARALVGRAFRLTSGRHNIAVFAPGFKPYMARFDADPSFPMRIRVVLAPE